MSFKQLIQATYGSGVHKQTSLYMKKITKMAKAKNQMTFLNRCIHHKLMPQFLRVHCPISSSRANNITENYRKNYRHNDLCEF